MKHAAIVPLIGGMTIAARNVFGQNPDFIVSWNAFNRNERLLTSYMPEVPRYLVDESGFTDDLKQRLANGDVDLVSALCPCAGLSRLNTSKNPLASGANAEQNKWMFESTKIVLGTIKPKVLIGENAPGLVQNKGEPVLNQLRQFAEDYGYSFSSILTNSMVHGLPQNRLRSFYVYWKSESAPIVEWESPNVKKFTMSDILAEAATAKTLNDVYLKKWKITELDSAYRFILLEYGMTHPEFAEKIVKPNSHICTIDHILTNNLYEKYMKWVETEDEVENSKKMSYYVKWAKDKNDRGMGYYYSGSQIPNPNGKINAFVGKAVSNTAHPVEDRYLNVREMMSMMRMPLDFDLPDPLKDMWTIPQNVPVTTAEFFMRQAKKFINNELGYSGSQIIHQNMIKQTYNPISSSASMNPFFK